MKDLTFEIIGDILIIREDVDEFSLKNFAEKILNMTNMR